MYWESQQAKWLCETDRQTDNNQTSIRIKKTLNNEFRIITQECGNLEQSHWFNSLPEAKTVKIDSERFALTSLM